MRHALDTIGLYNRMLIWYKVTKASRYPYPRHGNAIPLKVWPKRLEKKRSHTPTTCAPFVFNSKLFHESLEVLFCSNSSLLRSVHGEIFVELHFLVVHEYVWTGDDLTLFSSNLSRPGSKWSFEFSGVEFQYSDWVELLPRSSLIFQLKTPPRP